MSIKAKLPLPVVTLPPKSLLASCNHVTRKTESNPGTQNPKPETRDQKPDLVNTPTLWSGSYICWSRKGTKDWHTISMLVRDRQLSASFHSIRANRCEGPTIRGRARNLKPEPRNPGFETRNLESGTRNPEPETRNPDSGTRTLEPGVRNPNPKPESGKEGR